MVFDRWDVFAAFLLGDGRRTRLWPVTSQSKKSWVIGKILGRAVDKIGHWIVSKLFCLDAAITLIHSPAHAVHAIHYPARCIENKGGMTDRTVRLAAYVLARCAVWVVVMYLYTNGLCPTPPECLD